MTLPGCTESEYDILQTHGWFGAKCPCDPCQQQQVKIYKTISTSTEPSPSYRPTCSNCDVPRRVSPPTNLMRLYGGSPRQSPPGTRSPPPAYSATCRPPSTGSPPPAYRPPSMVLSPGMKSGIPVPNGHKSGSSTPSSGEIVTTSAMAVCVATSTEGALIDEMGASAGAASRVVVASSSTDLIDLCDQEADQYANFNPCYKSTTPPEDVVPYPILTQPMPLLESAPASMPSLQQYAEKPEILPPRSSTAPNVRGLDDLSEEGLWQPRGRSPRASWAGPPTNQYTSPSQGPWPLYDEVYIPPRGASPEPPIRSSSLPQSPQPHTHTSAKTKKTDKTNGATSRSMSQIPRLEMFSQTTRGGLQQRSISQQTVNVSPGNGGNGNHRASSPSIKVDRGTSTISSTADVWVPQVQPKQSASFAGLPLKEDQKTRGRSRLTQSCEQLQSTTQGRSTCKRTKRRCPTPPRVLSPNMQMESVKCEVIADI